MSTNSARHGLFDWLFRREQQPSGWQRYLHQREEPEYEPERTPLPMGLRQRAWLAQQARDTGEIPMLPPRTQDTEGMRRLTRPTGIDPRDWADVPTAKRLPGLDWLEKQLPNGALPVRRPVTDRPVSRPLSANLLPESRDEFRFAELPTWLAPSTIDARVSAALPPLPEPADDAPWLNSKPLMLTPLPEQFILSEQECAPDLSEEDATMVEQDRALYQLRLMARKQESE